MGASLTTEQWRTQQQQGYLAPENLGPQQGTILSVGER